MGVGEQDSLFEQTVHVWRLDLRMTSQSSLPIVEVINGNQQDVGGRSNQPCVLGKACCRKTKRLGDKQIHCDVRSNHDILTPLGTPGLPTIVSRARAKDIVAGRELAARNLNRANRLLAIDTRTPKPNIGFVARKTRQAQVEQEGIQLGNILFLLDRSKPNWSPIDDGRHPVIYDPVIYDPVIYDPVIYDPVIYDPVIYDPVIYDPVIYDPVIYDPVIYDPVNYDPVNYASSPAAFSSLAASSPSSVLTFFFFFIESFRTRTLGSPMIESPSFQRSISCNLARRSARFNTLRCL